MVQHQRVAVRIGEKRHVTDAGVKRVSGECDASPLERCSRRGNIVDVQRERVLAREGMSEAKLDGILARQMADAEKRARAHFVVDTSRGLEPAREQVAEIISALRDPQFKSARDGSAG